MFWKYTFGSTALTVAVIRYALITREHFYPAVVYLVTSKVAIALLGNQVLVLTLLLGRVAKSIFLGTLREVEVELLYENARYAITETCLALTIFREELTTRVLALFTALLFAKVFHWLASSRVDYLEHAERVTQSTQIRLTALMTWLFLVDISAAGICGYMCYTNGTSVLLLFGFEFSILLVAIDACASRYILFLVENSFYEGQWPAKGSYAFAVDFFAEFARLVLYLFFFGLVFSRYGLPLHIVRELWLSYITLKRRLTAYRRYRALTTHMDERFPDATQQELDECGRVCIICREHMDSAKKLPCGHIFHLACLRLWFQQQQSCPTCRADVPTDPIPQPSTPSNDDAIPQAQPQNNDQTPIANPGNPAQVQASAGDALAQGQNSEQQASHPATQSQQPLERVPPTEIRDTAAPLRRPSDMQTNHAAIWRVVAPDGAPVMTQRRTDAPVHRRINTGSCVLALDDNSINSPFLRIGDGWILRNTVVPHPLAEHTSTEPRASSVPSITTYNEERIFRTLEAIQNDLAVIKDQLRSIRCNQAASFPSAPVEEHKGEGIPENSSPDATSDLNEITINQDHYSAPTVEAPSDQTDNIHS